MKNLRNKIDEANNTERYAKYIANEFGLFCIHGDGMERLFFNVLYGGLSNKKRQDSSNKKGDAVIIIETLTNY